MKLRIPPVLQTLLCAAVSWLCARSFPAADLDVPVLQYVAYGLAFFGAVILLQAVMTFARQQTTVNPLEPAKANKLVISGLYRFTRNPMYLGLAAMLFALVFGLQNVTALAGPIAFMIMMTALQIKPEEAALEEKFGQQYTDYRNNVRRWL